MNLILFESRHDAVSLPRSDPRAAHLLDVLRRKAGDTFDAGVVNGPRGKGTLVRVDDDTLSLAFAWADPPPPLEPITVIVGLPRPQTARDILREATALGAGALHFVVTEKADPGYARSTLWSEGEWRRHLRDGAQQAFATHIPEVTHGRTLAETAAGLPADAVRLALDNYEATGPLGAALLPPGSPVAVALGPERGWGPKDRNVLRAEGFHLVHLGPRVLRTETAVIAALALVRARLGLM